MLSVADYYMESGISVAVNSTADVMIVVCLNLCGWMKLLSQNAEADDF